MRYGVAFTGSRSWVDMRPIRKCIEQLQRRCSIRGQSLVIIHGACPSGVDKLVDIYARRQDLVIDPHPAEWDRYGKAAGSIRNRTMLERSAPDLLIAFFNPRDLDKKKSTGTLDCIKSALNLSIPIEFHTAAVERFIF